MNSSHITADQRVNQHRKRRGKRTGNLPQCVKDRTAVNPLLASSPLRAIAVVGEFKDDIAIAYTANATAIYIIDVFCENKNPITEYTANKPVPTINIGLIPTLSYSLPAESVVITDKTEPTIVASPYAVSEKPLIAFEKIGNIIAFPIQIRYIQRLNITAILNPAFPNTRKFNIGFSDFNCKTTKVPRSKSPASIRPPLLNEKNPPLILLTPIRKAAKPKEESDTYSMFKSASSLSVIFFINIIPQIMIRIPTINRDAKTPFQPKESRISPA